MRASPLAVIAFLFSLLILFTAESGKILLPKNKSDGLRTFNAAGIVRDINGSTVVIQHEAVSNFMAAMTMPFNVKNQNELNGLKAGNEITFQLHVTDSDSWVSQIKKIGNAPVENKFVNYEPAPNVAPSENPLLDYKFTNELGQAVSFNDFHGQALAVTFFYTRCPLPNFCPRLSKNFAEAQQKLEAMTNAPANWHFVSVSFDPQFDTPQMLKSYGEGYSYDPKHWSFFTGSPEKIAEFARACGVNYSPDYGTINHNFRTLIVNASGHLQMVFPMSGDLSDQIVSEILKAASITNESAAQNQNR